VTIPDDFDVPAPFKKKKYPGGLYATCTDFDFDLGKWVENSGDYEHNPFNERAIGEEYFNPFNIYGLKSVDSKSHGFSYTQWLYPVREINKMSSEKKIAALDQLDILVSRVRPVEINLTEMVKRRPEHTKFELNYVNGAMVIKGYDDGSGMITPGSYNLPLKIEIRSTAHPTPVIGYGNGRIGVGDEMWVWDIFDSDCHVHRKCGEFPVNNEPVDIELIYGKDVMVVKVNGEIRHVDNDYGYIKEFERNSAFTMSSPVWLMAWGGATVTVESLRVTEL